MMWVLRLFAMIFALCITVFARTVPEIGKPVERELKAVETQSYQITLEKGKFLNAAVNQRGIDGVVRVFAPDNSKVAEIYSPNGDQGDEPILLEAKTAGAYRIEVSCFEEAKTAESKRSEIRVNALLSAEAQTKRLAALKCKQQGVISWLKNDLIPVKTVEAGNGFANLPPLPFRSIGSSYTPNFEAAFYPPKAMNKEFDGLFFIDTTTGARPNPPVKNVAP